MSVARSLRRWLLDDGRRSRPGDDPDELLDALYELPGRTARDAAEAAARLALRGLADWCVVTLEEDDGRQRLVGHPSGEVREMLQRALDRDPLELNRPHLHALTSEVLSTGRSLVHRPAADWTLRFYGRNPADRYALERLTPRVLVVEPLATRDALLGVVTFALMDGAPDRETRRIQARFARQLAGTLEQRRQLESLERDRDRLYQARRQVYSILDPDVGAVATANRQWELGYMNEAAETLLGLTPERHRGMGLQEALPRKALESPLGEMWVAALSQGETGDARFVESWTGADRWIEARAYPLDGGGAALYVRDISQEKERERKLQQHEQELVDAQKLESIGRLTGGVAHDFNNILMAINGHTELALRKLEASHPSRESLDEVRASADRGARLIRQLLAYSGKGNQQRRAVSLPDIVADLESSLLRLLGEDVELTVRSQWDVPPVLADPNQLEQIIMNLAVNARDAMPNGGQLRLDIERGRQLGENVEAQVETPADGWVIFSATDAGTGIPAHVLPHVFEPFFTTKAETSGTGLGLATVQGIVQRHGGTVAVESEVGVGTTIRVYLPATAKTTTVSFRSSGARMVKADEPPSTPAAEPSPTPEPEPRRPLPGAPDREGTILVVEDEPRVLAFVSATLRSEGYDVLEASNGADALAVMKRHGDQVRLLVTDVVMPYMGGRELSARLAETDPDIRVIYMSGYEQNEISQGGDVPQDVVLIEKPFTSGTLIDTVESVLAGATAALPCVA